MTWQARGRTTRDAAAGLTAAVGLTTVIVGTPVALALAVGWPLPRDIPSMDTVTTALLYGQVAPTTLLRGLAVVLWTTWALVVVSITIEVAAVVRGSVAQVVPGLAGLQRAAARLVATVMLVSSVATRAAAAPSPVPPASRPPAEAPVGPSAPEDVRGVDTPPATDQPARSWTVRRRDSLWSIAERTLGDGHRWREIAELNVGRGQPDGRTLGHDDTLIHPGWRLRLPTDATVPEAPSHVTVAAGDDLWGIAEQHLDDGRRWPEIFARNRGRRQPDGGRLDDPDMIRPGWVLQLPLGGHGLDTRPRQGDQAPHGARARNRQPPRTRQGDGAQAGVPHAPHGSADGAAARDAQAEPHGSTSTTGSGGATAPVAPPVSPSTLPRDGRAAVPARPGPGTGARHPTDRPAITPARHPARPPDRSADDAGLLPVGATTLLAAGLVGLLAHRRRQWVRRRRAGAVLDPVDHEAAELERWLRSMADHDLALRVDRILCVLAELFEEHDVAPDVVAAAFGEHVTLWLATPSTGPPPGIVANDDGRRWTVAAELEMAPPRGGRRFLPALVSCGRLPSGALLQLSPVTVAGTSVVGPRTQVADAMTSWTAELAAGGAAGGVHIVVVGTHHPLVERLARVTIAADPHAAVDRIHRVLDDAELSGPQIVVLCGPGAVDADDALLEAARHPGVGVVLFGRVRTATCVELDGDRVRLLPDGTRLDTPEWLTPRDWDRFGDLLRQTTHDHVAHPVPPTLRPVTVDVSDTAAATASDDEPDGRTVSVLGPLTIDARPSSLAADAAALLTYLAVHRSGGDPPSLHRILWPSRAFDPTRLAHTMAAIDAALGDALVVHTDDGRVELCDAVSTDVARVHDLLRALDRQPPSTQARRMYAALELVRGEPFVSGAAWAHADGTALRATGLVIDVAHRLAMQSLSIGDLERATWAVDRGLLAAPASELLHRDHMRIADARGDTAALDAWMRRLRARAEADGGWLTPDTDELYRRLRGSTAPDRDADAS